MSKKQNSKSHRRSQSFSTAKPLQVQKKHRILIQNAKNRLNIQALVKESELLQQEKVNVVDNFQDEISIISRQSQMKNKMDKLTPYIHKNACHLCQNQSEFRLHHLLGPLCQHIPFHLVFNHFGSEITNRFCQTIPSVIKYKNSMQFSGTKLASCQTLNKINKVREIRDPLKKNFFIINKMIEIQDDLSQINQMKHVKYSNRRAMRAKN